VNIAGTLDAQLQAAGLPIIGVSIGASADKSTWTVQPPELQAQAQPIIDAFDIPAEETLWQWWVIRTERDQKLYACDWTQISGAPLDAAEITEWSTYRESLRNVPADQADPFAIVWPNPPFVINPPPT
tara:strand:- start:664 stop:1047 length:384 start_codon:yes stop_codon:yes gene_type:complete